ncbi:L,D-transpeptidase family protein [Sphingobium xenophagum]|uniref:L,D-transpeptidase family protein n=1 Tax=Sphingobium xenophagum TaxID=121428 RepID=UPI0003729229|nr:L,D-transpeptidase family protein [Sphingobium xenophagum]
MLFARLFVLSCCLILGMPSARAELADLPLAPGAYRWADDAAASGPLYLIISLERQRVHVYRGDRLIGAASVSTGTKGHRTPTGSFPILQKRQWHRSNLYSNAPMPFMQRLTWDGIALHAGHNPGYPASHGCIRLPYAFARQLFALTQIGTLTQVTTNRLNAAILLDPLVLGDKGSSVVTFGMEGGMGGGDMRTGAATRVPLLEIDPDIFGVWGRR